MKEFSKETQEMLSVVDEYEQGEVNLEDAVAKISLCTGLDDERIAEILRGVERENVLTFPEIKLKEFQTQ